MIFNAFAILATVVAISTPKDGGKKTPITTPSGLQYVDTSVGKGQLPTNGQKCVVHYTGWLWEGNRKGKQFDTSKDGGGPFEFKIGVGGVIKGWDEGVLTMRVGGKRILIIPSSLGYGSKGTNDGVIPPDATLYFEIALLKVK